ncbi:RNA 3'-terminal phosphate cyclase [Rhodococcus sp. AW25M09]|nr:RNA 3'-terminal phosphate cyclase [Rhodococcus sp. AW25M09]
MEQRRLGPNDIPVGDPGFMVAIEVDHPFSDLTPQWHTDLLRSVDVQSALVEESAFGNARVVFHTAHCGWGDAGRLALQTERVVRRLWPTVAIEICRADVWGEEPFFDHEPHGLGDLPGWCLRKDPRSGSTVIVEVEPEGGIPPRLRDSDLAHVIQPARNARLSRSS